MRRNYKVKRLGLRREVERGVALVIVLIFLSLMLLLGLASTMTSITEVSVGTNLRLATEAFDVADSGAAHAFQIIYNMRGDFTCLLRGDDADDVDGTGYTLKNGDEFVQRTGQIFKNDGTIHEVLDGAESDMFDTTKVSLPTRVGDRAVVQLNPRHFYELIVYDNAHDPHAYMTDSTLEDGEDLNDDMGTDTDGRIIVRSIGYVLGTDVAEVDDFDPTDAISTAVVDIVIGLNPYPAVISNDDLEMTNSSEISGTLGSIHANDDLILGTGNFVVEQAATFSNQTTSGDVSGSGNNNEAVVNDTSDNANVEGYTGYSSPLYIPDLNPYDWAYKCEYILIHSDSTAEQRQGLVNKIPAVTAWLEAHGLSATTIQDTTEHLAIITDGDADDDGTPVIVDIRDLDGNSLAPVEEEVASAGKLESGTAVASAYTRSPAWRMRRLGGSGYHTQTVGWTKPSDTPGNGNNNNDNGNANNNNGSPEFVYEPSGSGTRVSVAFDNQGGMDVLDIPDEGSGVAIFALIPTQPVVGNNAPYVDMNGGVDGQVSIVTSGSVHMNGNAQIAPALRITPPLQPPWDRVDILAMAGVDVEMSGTAGGGDVLEGVLYAHEQFGLTGSGNINGQVVGYERQLIWDSGTGLWVSTSAATSGGSEVFGEGAYTEAGDESPIKLHRSYVDGNFVITHDVVRGYLGQFGIVAWRQLRDFNALEAARPEAAP